MRCPDAIIVCSTLLESSGSDTDIQTRIHDSVRDTFGQFRHQEGLRRRLAPQLVYPFILLLVCYMLSVFASFYVVRSFEGMYDEFGLDLPGLTESIFGLAASIRRWWAVGFVLIVVLGLFAFFVVVPGRRIPARTRVFRIGSLGLRTAWVAWAWHSGWLLKAGIDQSDAIALAGSCSSEPWLRRNSSQWADEILTGSQPFGQQPHGNWQPYGLLAHAFQLNDRNDQADVLHTYAAIHRDSASQRRLWWLSWVNPAVVVLVAALVILLVFALYAPLVDLIAGLR